MFSSFGWLQTTLDLIHSPIKGRVFCRKPEKNILHSLPHPHRYSHRVPWSTLCFLSFIIHPHFFTKHILLRTSSDFEYENWITLLHLFAIKQDSKHTSMIHTLFFQYMQFIVKLNVFKLEFTPYNHNLVMWTKFDPQVFNLIHNNSTPSPRHGDVSGIRLKPNRHACNPVLMNKGSTIMFFAIWCIIFLFILKLIFEWAIEVSNILFFRDNETDFCLSVSLWSW